METMLSLKKFAGFNKMLSDFSKLTTGFEEKYLITKEFSDITVNDMRIITAVGDGQAKNMSTLAGLLGITMGALTIAMNSLVVKEYVQRERSKTDRRVVLVSLTEKGRSAFHHCAKFRSNLIESIVASVGEDDAVMMDGMLSKLCDFFEEKNQEENKPLKLFTEKAG